MTDRHHILLTQEYTGWYRRTTLERLREHIRARFMGLMPDELARELQGLPRYAPSKTVTWAEDKEFPRNYEAPHVNEDPEPEPNVDGAGIWHNIQYNLGNFR